MARPPTLSLIIGITPDRPQDGLYVTWDAVPELLPSLVAYKTVLVVPGEGTEQQQDALVPLLKDQLESLGPQSIRVIWVLNSFTSPQIVDSLSLGRLIPLPGASPESLITWLRGFDIDSQALAFGLTRTPWAVVPFAVWRRPDKKLEVPVGVSSLRKPWILAPPILHPEDYLRVKWQSGSSYLWGFVLAIAIVIAVGVGCVRRYNHLEAWYYRDMEEFAGIQITDNLPINLPDEGLADEWFSPQERLAKRILAQEPSHWKSLARKLNTARPPEKLLSAERAEEIDASAVFDIAILSGDLLGALRVIDRSNDAREKEEILKSMGTAWQMAVESLHELDFPQSRAWTTVYLAMSQRAFRKSGGEFFRGAQRNRTLAHILQREFDSGRALALCHSSGVGDSFGRLLGGNYGSAIPEDISGLSQRRAKNFSAYCADLRTVRAIDYTLLKELEEMRNSEEPPPAGPRPSVCGIAPLECSFLSLRPEFENTLSQESIARILGFAAECSYLSDDAIDIVLRKKASEASAPRIDFELLDRAIRCTGPEQGDYFVPIRDALQAAPCDWFDRHAARNDRSTLPARRSAPSRSLPSFGRSSSSTGLMEGVMTRCMGVSNATAH